MLQVLKIVDVVEQLMELREEIEQKDVMIDYYLVLMVYSHLLLLSNYSKALDYINMLNQYLFLKKEKNFLYQVNQFILPNHISTNIPIAFVTLTNIRGNSYNDTKSFNFKFAFDCN